MRKRGIPFSAWMAMVTVGGLSVASQLVKGRRPLGSAADPRLAGLIARGRARAAKEPPFAAAAAIAGVDVNAWSDVGDGTWSAPYRGTKMEPGWGEVPWTYHAILYPVAGGWAVMMHDGERPVGSLARRQQTVYEVKWTVTVDQPDKRGPSYPVVARNTKVPYTDAFFGSNGRRSALALYDEIMAGEYDFPSEYVSSVGVTMLPKTGGPARSVRKWRTRKRALIG